MTQITSRYEGQLRTLCTHEASGQTLRTDAPTDNQGRGEFFSPTDLVATALGSCLLTIMGIAAQKIGVELTGSQARVEKIMTATPPRKIQALHAVITCPHAFEPKVQEQLEKAALGCPVHASLHPDIEQHIEFIWGKSTHA
jgi:putative redox protein